MARSQNDVVDDQFGPRASAYVESTVHASGEDLDALEAIVRRKAPRQAIDLGTGGGHVAYRLAPHAGCVTAVDLSAAMIAAVAETAHRRGFANIRTAVSPAESLPFEDASFDFLGCRFSAHHWRDFEAGLREARRILEPGSSAVFIDAISPAAAALDTHLQAIELLRDPSHVRDYTSSEWGAALVGAGFIVQQTKRRRLRMDYPTWIERMRTPPAHQAAIRSLQANVSAETSAYFEIEAADGSFMLDVLQIEAVAV